jgi:hypothetical protein
MRDNGSRNFKDLTRKIVEGEVCPKTTTFHTRVVSLLSWSVRLQSLWPSEQSSYPASSGGCTLVIAINSVLKSYHNSNDSMMHFSIMDL